MRELKGKATVLFDRDRGLEIELEDAASHVVIRARIPVDQVSAVMSRQAMVPCTIKWPEKLELVGKTRENKTVLIDKTWDTYNKEEERAAVRRQCGVEGICEDGWFLWSDGTDRQQPTNGKHSVTLVRYV